MLLTPHTALFATVPSLSSFFAVVLLLLRISVSILKFGELDQVSGRVCQTCRGMSAAVHLLKKSPLCASGSQSQGTVMQAYISRHVWGQLSFSAFFP